MKNLSLLFDLLLFPFLFLMRFVLSQGQDKHSHLGQWERGKHLAPIFYAFFFFIFASLNLQAAARNDCPPGANTANVSGTYNGSVTDGSSSNAWDSYSISIPSDGDLTIDYTSTKNTRVWFSTNNSNYCRNNKILNNGQSESNTLAVTAGQTVYLQLREMINGGQTANYSFTLSFSGTNTPPLADAGADQTITEGDDVTLDGSGSSDSDGTISSYSWSDGTSTWTGVRPTVSGLAVGTHTITLTVTDNDGATATDTVTITVTAPVAVDEITSFTAPSEVTEGETITVTVSYNVSQERQIVTGFQQNHSPWDGWGWTTVNVPAGVGTVNIPVDIPTGQPLSNGYQIPIVLEPVGGDWNSRLDSEAKNPVNLIASTCNGCDCSLDDNNVNNSSPGVVIPTLNGATTVVTKCISGTTDNAESSTDKNDYYNFTVQAAGTLKITTLSPNSHNFHMQIWKNGTSYYGDTTDQVHSISDMTLAAGDQVVVKFKETGSDLDEYQATFNFTTLSIIENADDLCYEEHTHSGMACVDMGFCSGGMGCTNTYPLRNIGNVPLSSATVIYDETGLGGSFGSNCSISPSGSCQTEHDVDMGPIGLFGTATTFDFDNDIPVNNNNESISSSNFMSMSCMGGDKLYATYIKNGSLYRGKINSCNAAISPIDPNFTQCGLFPSALNTWKNINRGNSDIVIGADTIFADNVIGNGNQDIECTNSGTTSNCSIKKMTLAPITLPTFISSPTSTAHITSSTETDRDYGSVTVNSDTHFSPSDTYADSSSHLMLMNSLTINNGATVTFDEGDYWIGTLTANASTKIRTTGKVRFFVNTALDLTQNHLDINYNGGNGLAKNLFIFVYGNFEFASNGGGDIQNMTAYVYVEGNYTANFNSANSHFKGAVTSVGDMNLNNNQKYTYDDAGLIGGWGKCNNTYCSSHNLTEGFHIVDPDGGDNKNSFEIFCYEDSNSTWHDLIALPIKNSSNNFLFDNNTTTSNYYDTTANPRTDFHAIEIDGGHITYNGPKPTIPVVTTRSDEPWQITTNGNTYNVLGSKFSNINLIGTPFKIDWSNSGSLEGCDESLLRKALGQAVKYNTINTNNGTSNDGKSRCKITTMKLTLLDDYQYLTYNSNEVLQHSCKEMATYVPNNILSDSSIAGHFNILTSEPAYPTSVPTTNGSRDNATDIGATRRPLTVYCKYQTDLKYVWTFLTALDAKVTQSKNDLVNHQDTCSQLGLYFYVPNNKETFDRVRQYLKDSKSGDDGWENYTGTINEKIRAFHPSNQYYLSKFRDVTIWPYGPLGVYFPLNGNHKADGTTADWGNGANTPKGYMSGSPMHNITSLPNYNDSLGKKGWVSILGSQDLNKTDDWWIADIGAGEEIGNSSPGYSPHGSHPIQSSGYKYYEPNGNYSANAWLNFIYDSEGWIYHADDWNNNYPYYDYMCMSETNYDTASRYALVPGFFNVIERGTRVGNSSPNFSDENITTKIVAKPIQLDLILYKLNPITLSYDKTQLETDQNKSVGVFISSAEENTTAQPVKFIGTYSDFDTNNGRIALPDITITSAKKRMLIQFYYCNAADTNWTTCWNYNNNPNSPTISPLGEGNYSDSADDFAVRPDRFALTVAGGTVVKAKDVNITYYAYNYTNQPTTNYNETLSSINAPLADTSKESNCTNKTLSLPDISFTNGVDTNRTTLVNVGIFNINIAENNGSEFALIDADDTPDIDRFISPYDINLTILPDHFHIDNSISQINNNNIGNFTYLANDLDKMAMKFDFNITAQNSGNVTTPNYSSQCYANDTNISLKYNANIPAVLTKLYYKELNSNIDGNVTATDAHLTHSLPKSIFTNDNNGTAEIKLRINFSRDKNSSINPFKVNFTDLNVSDKSTPPVKVGTDSTHTIDANATMLYGRAHAAKQRYEVPIDAPYRTNLYYEIYCYGGDCNTSMLPSPLHTDDIRWYQNTNHNVSTDGNITGVSEKGAARVSNSNLITTTNPSTVDLSYDGTMLYPYQTTMEINASKWLIYNPNGGLNEFQVEFYKANTSWSGEHETNTTTKANASKKGGRRINW